MWAQHDVVLEPRPRGFHLVTDEVVSGAPSLSDIGVGLCHVWIKHTSASLTVNENADPSVRRDFRTWFDRAVPDDATYFEHTAEGPDDMTSHIKSSLLGPSLTLPVSDGRLALGTWQGIYLCEHRERGGARRLTVTVWGE
jgi:secondary thiamine-phosphate synthase enzyme